MTAAKERVREAAVHLFATKGFHGTGIRDLAEAAGLSSASLYHYMGTKEDLLVQIMSESLERLLSTGRELVASAKSPTERIGLLVQLHVVTHAIRQEVTTVVDNELRALSDESRQAMLALRDDYEDLWRNVIEEGCRQGSFSVANSSIARLGLLELCTGVARWYSPSGTLTLAEVTEAHVQMAFAILGVQQGRARKAQLSVPPVEVMLQRVSDVWGISVP